MGLFETHLVDSIKNPYSVVVADMNGDGKQDIVVCCTGDKFIAWYEAPDWKRHIISTQTTGNISIDVHDIDGDGKPDVAVGCEFNMHIAKDDAFLQWFCYEDGEWVGYKIDDFPFCHGVHFADIDGDGEKELISSSMRGTVGAPLDWEDPGFLLYYKIPKHPKEDKWVRHVIDDKVKRLHFMHIVDLNGDGKLDIVVACKQGIFWYEPGDEAGSFNKYQISDSGGGNIFVVDINGDGINEVVSLEPWHGNELVIYTTPDDMKNGTWERTVIDDTFSNAHAVCCADMNNDGKIEIVAGYRGEGTSLYYYERDDVKANRWRKHLIDDNMGITGIVITDIDGDGKLDIVGAGQTTNNLKWYRNLM